VEAADVTVVIDAYNYGQYIEEAVESVLTQDFPAGRCEVIVVDDGSTDDTIERLSKYGERIRCLTKANGGQASAFNLGFEQASGGFIALLDADDVWLPGKLRQICDTFEKHPEAGLVYHRALMWQADGRTSPDTDFVFMNGRIPETRGTLLRYPMIRTSCLAFRRESLRRLLPVPAALRSQADAYLTALIIFVSPVAAVREALTKYRVHGSNLFHVDQKQVPQDRIQHRMAMRGMLLGAIKEWLEENGYDPESDDLRAYLKQWTKLQESDGFALRAPSRGKYFWHLVEYPRIYGEIMSPRHRLYSYVQAVGALFLGYHHLHLLDELRNRLKRFLGDSAEETLGADDTEGASAKG
jgi:glycosyltransferase involved in cell wall biosynthesis